MFVFIQLFGFVFQNQYNLSFTDTYMRAGGFETYVIKPGDYMPAYLVFTEIDGESNFSLAD